MTRSNVIMLDMEIPNKVQNKQGKMCCFMTKEKLRKSFHNKFCNTYRNIIRNLKNNTNTSHQY